jgi:hypothetical protein
MSLITSNTSSAAAVTPSPISHLPDLTLPDTSLLPSFEPSPTSSCYLRDPLSLHAYHHIQHSHFVSTILQLSLRRRTLAKLNRQLPLRLQCPSPTSDLQYLTSPQRLHFTCPPSSLLDTATSARKATRSAWVSQTPTSSSLRDLGGDTDTPMLTLREGDTNLA